MTPWPPSPFRIGFLSCSIVWTPMRKSNVEPLCGERRDKNELGARVARGNLQRRVQLFRERADHAGPQALSPAAKFETFR